jgi:tRNA dimethylallyltransferase
MNGSQAPKQARNQEPGPRIRVGFVVGPTGVGKSAFALELAERLNCEIVAGDSRQLYRGMTIGTAQPDARARRRVRHHLFGACWPDEPLDAAGFVALARRTIDEMARRGARPLVVGGSGLYLRALRDGLFAGPGASADLRQELIELARERGQAYLHARLAEVDGAAAQRIAPADLKRTVRALEVYRLTGTPISAYHARHGFKSPAYLSLSVGLNLERPVLYAMIDRRLEAMLAAGLLEEVKSLAGAAERCPALVLNTIGYREVAAHLRGELTIAQAQALAARRTRQLAKRQLTWFRQDATIVWLDPRRDLDRAVALFARFFSAGRGCEPGGNRDTASAVSER